MVVFPSLATSSIITPKEFQSVTSLPFTSFIISPEDKNLAEGYASPTLPTILVLAGTPVTKEIIK